MARSESLPLPPETGSQHSWPAAGRSVPLCVKDTLLAPSISLSKRSSRHLGNNHSCSWEPSLKQENIKGLAERETRTQRMSWNQTSCKEVLKGILCLQKKPQGVWNQERLHNLLINSFQCLSGDGETQINIFCVATVGLL